MPSGTSSRANIESKNWGKDYVIRTCRLPNLSPLDCPESFHSLTRASAYCSILLSMMLSHHRGRDGGRDGLREGWINRRTAVLPSHHISQLHRQGIRFAFRRDDDTDWPPALPCAHAWPGPGCGVGLMSGRPGARTRLRHACTGKCC